jgi:uncharacterized protein YkwD
VSNPEVTITPLHNFLNINPVSPQNTLQDFRMSDTYTLQRYQHQTPAPLGTNRRKKYFRLFLVGLIIASIAVVYLVSTSGLLAEDNPQIPQQMLSRINLERQANNLPLVQLSETLTQDALKKSQEVKISPIAYQSGAGSRAAEGTNVLIIPKISWAISSYDFRQQMFDSLENNDNLFRKNILDRNYHMTGIGVTGDGYNYYIVTKWE